jgi:superfamily II DNA or RNA helicase
VAFDTLHFQVAAVAAVAAKFSSTKRVLMQSATGSGKTVMAGMFLQDYLAQPGTKVLALVNLQALVGQFHDTLSDFGVSVSVLHDEIKSNKDGLRYSLDYARQVLLTMPTTFINTRAGKNCLTWDETFEPTLILIDEAHKGTSADFQFIRDLYPNALVLGLTATPYRAKNDDGECLVEWYGESIVFTVSVRDLIEMKRLVQPRYVACKSDDHVVNTWLRETAGHTNRRTIVFTRDTKHSYATLEAFEAAGINARVITAGTDADPDFYITPQTPLQRQVIYNDFDAGRVEVLISVSALCEGFDSPLAKFCFLTRGVGNHALYHQMVGRVLRWHDSKDGHAVVVDFHENLKDHGCIVDYQWSLEASKPSNVFVERNATMSKGTFMKKTNVYHACQSCNHVYDIKSRKTCYHCDAPHGVVLAVSYAEMLEEVNVLSKAAHGEMMMRLRPALSDPMYQGLFNKKFFPAFEGGQLKSEFAWLEQAANADYRDDYLIAA